MVIYSPFTVFAFEVGVEADLMGMTFKGIIRNHTLQSCMNRKERGGKWCHYQSADS